MKTTERPTEAPRQTPKPLTFISDDGFRSATLDGVSGVIVEIRLTSYRSLPLSCIREITLSLDGTAVDMSQVTFLLDGNAHSLASIAPRTDLWWFVLDAAELFVPLPSPLAVGDHLVEGSLSTIVPYATGGRATDTQHSSKRLILNASI